MMGKIIKGQLILLLLSLLAGHAVAQSDQIYSTSGARLEGNVVGVSPVAVEIDVRGSKRSVSVNEISRVTFAEDPPGLQAGRARAIAGKYKAALVDLQMVNPAEIERELVRQDLIFYLAFVRAKLALTTGGDKREAAAAMLAFVRAAPRSQHFFSAAELLGDLSLAQGDYSQAVKYYGAVSNKAPWPSYSLRAKLSEARATIAEGNYQRAQQIYDAVLADKSNSVEAKRQKLFAQIGKSRCVAETGSVEEAIAEIENIIDQNDSSDAELFGRAYNALGECYRKAGKPKEALMAYLHIEILFYADSDIHAEALHNLVELWDELKNPDRSVAAKNLLNERYAGSVWANQ
ncbi:tetratricopeptide repeat protein [Roseiconus lacunae]|uniref:tetratricopeptide repeat protein n=1 Tax=Roseiconus lacunae TaxID=2605694 RepID=UPI001E3D645D|nr:tetratricopeptide repeat protein [Roseiconus lacunae]MCD0460289.1 hypothetical protein [Roseiconus lacunae]